MTSDTDYKFEGWVAHDASSVDGNMKWQTYTPKPFTASDIDIKITHCGVCGTDLSSLRSGWKPADYPIVVGHEIVGHVVRVGSNVTDFQPGDRVGVGAQCKSCLQPGCRPCNNDMEQHCPDEFTTTYDARYKEDGSKAYGGYARYWRGPASFVFKIPGAIPSEIAAPLLCGGLTVYAPLTDNGAGPGKRVGIAGFGGLGHLGVLFAKALGCEKVVAISRSASKREDALRMGADEYIATADDEQWHTKHARSLDLIISTISGADFPLDKYLSLLDVKGNLIQVGAPEDPMPSFSAFSLLVGDRKVGGSTIGSRKQAREMLELAAKTNLRAWVQVRPMSEANQVVVDMDKGNARYRYVLQNE
ncbi:GroES-like protein [Sodiomyces alkalinus F11]|uniref:alcohol dehydrogenase (NADP(+)) n=1 Tax=Sodiomyces alkalinus (strain CBS 110278 / VKM F-3762 / F11) TaxID=1314773 RepID=A0A3N2PKV4_SODAK|nr:GroES-like protein [Sodiomyces alkalinus F11]ROT35152.1 GroES-like protein [Sodiomyces alkalinus F11]